MRKGRSSKVDYWPTLPPPLLREPASGRKEKEKETGRDNEPEKSGVRFSDDFWVTIGSTSALTCVFSTTSVSPIVMFLHSRWRILLSAVIEFRSPVKRLGHYYYYLMTIIWENLYVETTLSFLLSLQIPVSCGERPDVLQKDNTLLVPR